MIRVGRVQIAMNRWIDELMNWRQTLNSLQKAMSANHCRFRPSQIICPEIAFCLLSIWFGWSVLIVFLFLSIGFGWSVLRLSFFYPFDLDDLVWDWVFIFIHLIWMIYPEIAFFYFSYIWFGWSVLRLHFLFVIHLIWMICPEMAFLFLSIWFVYQFDLFIHLIGMICPAIAF